jgi:ribonuclease D
MNGKNYIPSAPSLVQRYLLHCSGSLKLLFAGRPSCIIHALTWTLSAILLLPPESRTMWHRSSDDRGHKHVPTPHNTAAFINTPDALAAFAKTLQGAPVVAIDTEFVGENSYFPRLEIIQVATAGAVGIIDHPALPDLGPLFEILYDPAVEKVFHAGTQDLEIFYTLSKRPLASVFDTQIAAAFVGYGDAVSYASLVERVTGKHLKKLHTVTDWSQRPLSPSQLAYAAEDVTYLLPVHEHLVERLRKLDRLDWVREECRPLEGIPTKALVEDHERFRRVKDRHRLSPRELGILRELAAWREEASRQRNQPRLRIVSDEVLVEIARLVPAHVADLRNLRRLYPRAVERYGEAIVGAVRRGLDLPENELPEHEKGRSLRVRPGVPEMLNAVLRARAEEHHIAPPLIATMRDLELLAHDPRREEARALPVLNGWRREMVGNELVEILEGRSAVRLEGRCGRVRVEPAPAAPAPAHPPAKAPAHPHAPAHGKADEAKKAEA